MVRHGEDSHHKSSPNLNSYFSGSISWRRCSARVQVAADSDTSLHHRTLQVRQISQNRGAPSLNLLSPKVVAIFYFVFDFLFPFATISQQKTRSRAKSEPAALAEAELSGPSTPDTNVFLQSTETKTAAF